MSIIVSSARTMAGAKRIVVDEGINIAPCRKRERLIDLSRRWQQEQRAKRERADQMIRHAVRKHRRTRPHEPGNNGSHPSRLIAMVAAWHDMTAGDILGGSRNKRNVAARYDAIAAVWLNCRIDGRRYSLPEVGRAFNGMDHTTVLYALRKVGVKPAPAQS